MLTFFIGVLSGFCLALPVGAVALMCINKTLQFGFKSGLAVGLGAAFADAFYAPVVMRFECFDLPISASGKSYIDKILSLPSVQQWIAEAKQEQMFVPFDEPYRQTRDEYLKK